MMHKCATGRDIILNLMPMDHSLHGGAAEVPDAHWAHGNAMRLVRHE